LELIFSELLAEKVCARCEMFNHITVPNTHPQYKREWWLPDTVSAQHSTLSKHDRWFNNIAFKQMSAICSFLGENIITVGIGDSEGTLEEG